MQGNASRKFERIIVVKFNAAGFRMRAHISFIKEISRKLHVRKAKRLDRFCDIRYCPRKSIVHNDGLRFL